MSLEEDVVKEEHILNQYEEYEDEENGFDDDGEICFENDYNESFKPKSSKKKKSKNEHRKTKKRKHKEISDDSSDDNLLSIKNKQEMLSNKKKLKKSKKGSKSKKKSKKGISNIYVKQEVLSANEQNGSDESEEDVPLSQLDRDVTKHSGVKVKIKKTYEISNSADTSDVEGKVKKLKLKKVNDSKSVCMECNKTFTSNVKYKAHVRKVHGPKTFVCVICYKAFQKEKDLLNHHNTHTGQNPYCCGECGKLFKSDGSLKKHIRIYHADNSKKYACSMCPKVLSSASCLEEHERLHTGESPWACNLCGKLFARERDLKLHANLHEELFKCDVCQRCFITSFKLKEHYRSHTGETPYECDKCDRKFARLADYRYHVGTHLGLKPFACDLCDIKFTTSSSMKRHLINMHQQGPLDFKCHICSKGFHTQSRLNSHVKNHENKKKYTCHLCNATRSSQSELQRHLILHSGEFRCDTCNRNCSSAQRLAAHVAKHDLTGKPYACFVCSLGYQTSQSLNKHLATIHKNEDIPKVAPQHLCTLCGNVYDHKDKLNRHLKDDHIVLAVGEIHSLLDDQQYGKSENTENIDSQSTPDLQTSPVSSKPSQPTTPLITLKKEESLTVRTIKNRKKVFKKSDVDPDIVNNEDNKKTNEISTPDSALTPDCSETSSGAKITNSPLKSNSCENITKVNNQQSNDNTLEMNSSKEKDIPQKEPLLVSPSCVKLEKDESSPCPISKIKTPVNQNKQQNAEEIIQSLARKNIENYLQKQEIKDVDHKFEVKNVQSKISNGGNSNLNNSNDSQTTNDKRPDVASLVQGNNSFSECEINYKFSDTKTSNITQKSLPDTPTPQIFNDISSITNRNDSQTKREIESNLHEPTNERGFMDNLTKRDYLEPEQKSTIPRNSTSHILSNFPQMANYFDDARVKDLSALSDNKNLKTQYRYDNIYDNLYSKTSYNESLSQQNKIASQNTYKNMNDMFDNYNQTQSSIHQASNPWYSSSKMSSLNQDEVLLKPNVSRSFAEAKQKDTKASRIDNMFQMQLHGYNQYNNQQLPSNPLATFHKDNYYDKKSSYGTANLEHKNYFDNFNQKQFLHDDRKRSAGANLYDEVTRQNIRSYQPLQAQLTSEHTIPSFNDQLNYYNPHALASMANSPHLFHNFRELQQRMLNSGIPGYNHHSRQHLFSGMEMSNQRMANSTSSYNQINPNLNSMSPLTQRQPYSDISMPDGSIPSFPNNRHPTNTSDGQGKDDENGPYELRVAAN